MAVALESRHRLQALRPVGAWPVDVEHRERQGSPGMGLKRLSPLAIVVCQFGWSVNEGMGYGVADRADTSGAGTGVAEGSARSCHSTDHQTKSVASRLPCPIRLRPTKPDAFGHFS